MAMALALCLSLSLCPMLVGTAHAAAQSAMDKLVNWGVVHGYPDGSLRPERTLTRAEFVAMVNRAYGYNDAGEMPFTDVPSTAWYHDDIATAYNAKYFSGVSPRRAGPDLALTREQAMVLLARNMRLDPIPGEVVEFNDGREFSNWSRGYARAAAQIGMINGYGDGNYRPHNNITRGDMASMLQRALGTLVNKPGTHTLSDVYGNVTISSTGTTLKDTTIGGDLYITGGLDLGDVELENVRVLGKIIVAGGGESHSGEDSIILRNVEADSLLVDSIADQFVSLRTEGNTTIDNAELRSDAFIQDRTRPGQGLMNITLDSADPAASFTLSGNLENVLNKTPGSTLNVAMGTVDTLTVDEKARESTLNLDVNSTVLSLNLDTAANVSGIGDIAKLQVNAAGSTVEMLPDTIAIRPGLTASIAGEPMNAVQAQESSADPRLLAGYPKVRNIAATSATSVFAGNKAGTVYWAVSPTVDGSIDEEELITPTQGNTHITANGNLPLTASNTEVTSAINRLAADSNYYISAVMTDARGRHSPVKVASFTTPDTTVPAFAAGYPRIMLNDYTYERDPAGNADHPYKLLDGERVPDFRAQVGVMASKSCQLYYVLYPAGSTQPSAQQFRTGALGEFIKSGVEDVTKNQIWTNDFTGLKELTSYDLYLWLCDADGSRSSNVQKLTFTTVDGRAPRFQYDTPVVEGNPPATSIPTRANLSENATVHWVVVKQGVDYIKRRNFAQENAPVDMASAVTQFLGGIKEAAQQNDNLYNKLNSLKIQIETGSGSGVVSSGQANVTANRNTTVNLTGLAAETAYDVYMVATDPAGNISDIAIVENVRTLDTTPPTVVQRFSRPDDTASSSVYADTDIELIFSENIKRFPETSLKDANGNDVRDANGEIVIETLLNLKDDPAALSKFLSSIIFLYNESGDTPSDRVKSREELGESADWTIDFRKAEVSQDPDTGAVTVKLPSHTTTAGVADGAINLRSGSTYHFTLNNIQDLATTPNRLRGMPLTLDSFRTIAAQVLLREDVSSAEITSYKVGNDTHDTQNSPIEVDMAFSLRPVSVNVEDNVLWDMILWSDSSVEFDLYTRELNLNTRTDSSKTTPWTLVEPKGYIHENKGKDDNPEANSSIIIRTGSGESIGRSLYTHFMQKGQERIHDTLFTNKIYEYAIHFTKVGDVEEGVDGFGRAGWNQDITFHIDVLTGTTTQSFRNLTGLATSSGVTEASYQRGLREGLIPIQTTNSNTNYFSMFKSFSVSVAPNFIGGYPVFSPQDTAVSIRVMTDRPGTVYYVVAPFTDPDLTDNENKAGVPTVPPTPLDGNKKVTYGLDNNNNVTAYYTAGDKTHPIPTQGQSEAGTRQPGDEFQVREPSRTAVALNPNFGNDRVKVGSLPVSGNGYQTINVTGLDPDTSYYAYFVLQSQGQPQYSPNPMLYQFWTEAAFRPNLSVRSQTSVVTVTHIDNDKELSAVADYAIYEMTSLMQTILWDKFNTNDVLKTNKTSFEKDSSYSSYKNYRVYEAIQQVMSDGESLFDKYASSDFKRAVANLAGGAPSSIRHSLGSIEVPEGGDRSFDTALGTPPIKAGNNYYILIAGRYKSITATDGNSIAFRGASPLFIADNESPKLDQITGSITITYAANGNATVTGNVDLQFNKELYYNFGGNDITSRYPIHLFDSDTNLTDDTAYTYETVGYETTRTSKSDSKTKETYTSVLALKESGSGFAFVTSDSNKFRQTRAISLSANTVSPYITLKQNLAGQLSPSLTRNIFLSLDLRNAEEGILPESRINFTAPNDIWLDSREIRIEVKINRPETYAQSLLISSTGTTLNVGDSFQLSATPNPSNAVGTIVWTVEPIEGSGGTVNLNPATGRTVTVTAAAAGKVKVIPSIIGENGTTITPQIPCTITINDNGIKIVDADGAEPDVIEIERGKYYDLGLSIPASVRVTSILWESYNPTVATVQTDIGEILAPDKAGRVEAIAVGSTTISVTVVTSAGTYTDTQRITVKQAGG